MKLVMYSGYDAENAPIDEELIRLTGKSKPKVTFIPASDSGHNDELDYFCDTFKYYGVRKVSVFHVDLPFSEYDATVALESDFVYLSGGNTFHFAYHMKRSKFVNKLQTYVEQGGVLAGLSAGSILMTPSIQTASFPAFDCDENFIKLKDMKAMNLVPFEFFPHFTAQKRYVDALLQKSKKNKYPILAVPDGAGIVVNHHAVQLFGEIVQFYRGQSSTISLGR